LATLDETAIAYNQDPTPENCRNYKAAIEDYADTAEGFDSCLEIIGQADVYRKSIEEIRRVAESLDCN